WPVSNHGPSSGLPRSCCPRSFPYGLGMAGKRNHRGRDKPRRPHVVPRPHQAAGAEEQELIRTLRGALRSNEPLTLLETVSGLLELTDPRRRDPFGRDEPSVELAPLVDSFVDTPYAETTAALTVMSHLVTDNVITTRIRRELAARRQPMPDWLTGLAQV